MRYVSALAPAAGAAYVVLDVAILALPGAPPKARDADTSITDTLAAHRPAILAGVYLAGLALIAWAVFLGAVWSWRTRSGPPSTSLVAALAAGVLAVSLQLIGLVAFYGAALTVAGEHEVAVVRALVDGGNGAIELGKFAFAAFVAAVCVDAADELGPSFVAAGLAAAAAGVVGAVALVTQTPLWQLGGPVDLLTAAPLAAWILALSVRLARRPVRLAVSA